MSLSFAASSCAKFRSASWLDNVTKLTIFCRVKFTTITTGKQYVFQHRLGTTNDQISLRKDNTTNFWKVSATRGGVSVAPAGINAITAGTPYTCIVTYEVGVNPGIVLYVNGAQECSATTATQSGSYSTAGGDLYLAARSAGAEFLEGAMEGFAIWAGWNPTAAQRGLLFKGFGWQRANLPRPSAFYRLDGQILTRVLDSSGNGRHIEAADIGGTVTAAPGIGLWQPTRRGRFSGSYPAVVAAIPDPNPWALIAEPPHPNASYLDTGLTNGTAYEYYAQAVDAGGNVGPASNIVTATPAAPPPAISQISAPWTRQRRWSKWRSTQQ